MELRTERKFVHGDPMDERGAANFDMCGPSARSARKEKP